MKQSAIKRTRSGAVSGRKLSMLAVVGSVGAFFVALEHWRRQQQLSMQFAAVEARTLRDAGISEARRFIEVNRPFE
jgi:uncharacterized protein YjiS (DUF1127 family)